MTFTPVTIKRGSEGLAHTTGFWSGEPTLINGADEPTIYLLNKDATTSELLYCIDSFIDGNLHDWVMTYYKKWVPTVLGGKFNYPFFTLQGLPALSRPECKMSGYIAAPKVIEALMSEGKNVDEICEFLADEWTQQWRSQPTLGLSYSLSAPIDLPQIKMVLLPWAKLDASVTPEEFLQDLSNLSEMDLSTARFLDPEKPTKMLQIKSDVLKAGFTESEKALLVRVHAGWLLSNELTISNTKILLALPQCASFALALLAREGHILVSDYLPGSLNLATIGLGMLDNFGDIKEEKSGRMGLSGLLMTSSIRSPKDIPADLRDLIPKDLGRKSAGPGTIWRPLRRLLLAYAAENSLKAFDISPFERGANRRKENAKWSPEWFRDEKHSKEWCDFVACMFESNNANEHSKTAKIGVLAGWGLRHFSSPWDIKPINLRDPSKPKNTETFFAYCKEIGRESSLAWSQSANIFDTVVKASSVPGYPWYREKAISPFKNIANPFPSSNRGNGKTHRSRISTIIHEKMIEVLLDLDENGKPTFEWAKNNYGRADVRNGVWCPSRWTLLANLLLLPLRKKQGRWLDQGLMDPMVFDPETFKMAENTHLLRDYTYEDGETHLERYGRPSGAIQPITDSFMGVTNHLGIFVNTNKTQLWNPTKHNGYELPWPDGNELLASDDEELQQHGMWLRRIYEVLAYQYRYVLEHDSDPVPITYYDVPDDKDSVSQHEHIKQRMPSIVPLFRDVAHPKQVRRAENLVLACLPVSPVKLLSAYTALCIEVENRLRSEGFEGVTLTTPKTSSGDEDSYSTSYRSPKFDIHCLRVAGISRLIEMDIDPVIVQEFMAGHLTMATTHHYIKLQPWHVREKIIEAIVNGDFKTAMENYAEKVAKGENHPETTLVYAHRFREHIKDLPEDFVSFAVVEGGICTMGGKGDPCDEGGVYERDLVKKDGTEIYFGPVRGGCGNCRYFRSAPFLIQEQALYLDVLMSELRALAKQRKEIRTQVTNIKCKIDDCEDAQKQVRLINDLNLYKGRLEALNHNMVPAITEWVNRYQILDECQIQMEAPMDAEQSAVLVAPFQIEGLTASDLKVELEETTDIGLMGRIIEKARVMGCCGIPIPENQARMLEQAVDRLLRMNGSASLLLDVTSRDRIRGASMLYNALEDMVGPQNIQYALDNSTPLALPEGEKDAINRFASAIVETANKGSLTLDGVIGVAKSGNLLSEGPKRGEKWAM